jgi:hypothetical protein
MKGFLIVLAGLAGLAVLTSVGAASTGTSAKAPSTAKITIRHQTQGCHSWALNGGTYRAVLSTRLARGGTITVTDNDVMPHRLIRTSGPAVHFRGLPSMHRMGASVKVVFPKAGVYHFVTKAGEDYMDGVKTIGEDNVLRLTVRVS